MERLWGPQECSVPVVGELEAVVEEMESLWGPHEHSVPVVGEMEVLIEVWTVKLLLSSSDTLRQKPFGTEKLNPAPIGPSSSVSYSVALEASIATDNPRDKAVVMALGLRP
jgi:hypothetical protein